MKNLNDETIVCVNVWDYNCNDYYPYTIYCSLSNMETFGLTSTFRNL